MWALIDYAFYDTGIKFGTDIIHSISTRYKYWATLNYYFFMKMAAIFQNGRPK